jgi:hypothetical protein
MRAADFELAGLDLNDTDAFGRRWDAWVADLFSQGLRPSEEPTLVEDDRLVFTLTPIHAINDFNRDTLAGVA